MWNRKTVKETGKARMNQNYWLSVLVAFLYSIIFSSTGAVNSQAVVSSGKLQDFINDPDFLAIILGIVAFASVIAVVSFFVKLFVLNPLEVGCFRFFFANQEEKAQLGELGYGFVNRYFRSVFALFLRELFIGIGLFLFVIPGIIMSFSYRLVPYILADDPTLDAGAAVHKSRMLMKGNKWRMFVFDLSFILWELLGLITLGLVSIFYVNPYKKNAEAALYKAIKESKGM
ncbi:MAG: DUF975 family protein [Lachnospiraceae bacterium]|nr:DUF975 family protein [Lachnospiraceae bacterium]